MYSETTRWKQYGAPPTAKVRGVLREVFAVKSYGAKKVNLRPPRPHLQTSTPRPHDHTTRQNVNNTVTTPAAALHKQNLHALLHVRLPEARYAFNCPHHPIMTSVSTSTVL
jgi:hypothetical protein